MNVNITNITDFVLKEKIHDKWKTFYIRDEEMLKWYKHSKLMPFI